MCDPISFAAAGTILSTGVSVIQQRQAANDAKRAAAAGRVDPEAESRAATDAANRRIAARRQRRMPALGVALQDDTLGGTGGSVTTSGGRSPFMSKGKTALGAYGDLSYGGL